MTRKPHPPTPEQRHDKASRMALANIAQHGTDALRDNMRRGFLRRFERQVDAADPHLRDRDPVAYQARVHDALQAHMRELSRRSLASRAAKRAARDNSDTA